MGPTDDSHPDNLRQALAGGNSPSSLTRLNNWLGGHQWSCFWGIFGLEVILRCALLCGSGIPSPSYHDEFSYLLASDTYASGRLANPPLPRPEFFETEHVLLSPTYASKYQPGQGLFLAFGQRVFGHPFFGVLLSVALGAAAMYWALLAWTPPAWAVVGGLSVIAIFGCVSYWVDSYWGGGVAFLGAALALGSWGRIRLHRHFRSGALLALGSALLLLSRPYESCLLLLALFVSAAVSVISAGRRATGLPSAARSGALTLCAYAAPILAAYGGFQLYFNYRVTGHALRLPYLEYARQYDVISQFRYLPLTSLKPSLNHRVSLVHNVFEVNAHQAALQRTVFDDTMLIVQNSSAGLLLITLLCAGLAAFRDAESRRLLALLALPALPVFFETFLTPHYLAPFLACLILLLFQSLATLFRQVELDKRKWLSSGRYAVVAACLVFGLAYLIYWKQTVLRKLSNQTYAQRQRKSIMTQLGALPGTQLVFVTYGPRYSIHDEWVYNRAQLEQAKVIFAHDLSTELDQALLAEYPGRQALRLTVTPESAALTPLAARSDRVTP